MSADLERLGVQTVKTPDGRRYATVEVYGEEHAPTAAGGTVGPPPLLAWALLCCSGAVLAVGFVATLFLVGIGSPWGTPLALGIAAGGLFTVVTCGVAAAKLGDAYGQRRLLAETLRGRR